MLKKTNAIIRNDKLQIIRHKFIEFILHSLKSNIHCNINDSKCNKQAITTCKSRN